jgi:hypothetical protein
MMSPKRQWLAGYSWEFVTAQNAILCAAKNALHKPTSDTHETTKTFGESRNQEAMELTEAVEICWHCHRLAPFLLY